MKKWSGSIGTKWTPPKGLFAKPAGEIAAEVYIAHDSLASAIASLNYYVNRAGSKLSTKDRERLAKAADMVRARYGAAKAQAPLAMQTEKGMIREKPPVKRQLTELEKVNRAVAKKRRAGR